MTGDILVAEKKDSGASGTAQIFIAGNPTGWRQDMARRVFLVWYYLHSRLAVVLSFVILVCAASTLALVLVWRSVKSTFNDAKMTPERTCVK